MKIENDMPVFWDIQRLSESKNIKEASMLFESEFLHMFLKEVRKSINPLGNSLSSKFVMDMFDMQLSKMISEGEGIGISKYIQEAVKEYQKNSS
jgi:Rod binding domain-containing protein